MKKLRLLFTSSPLLRKLATYLAATATVAVLTVGAPAWLNHAQAQTFPVSTQVATLDQLLADFHGALSYGGNLTAMMSLWTEDSSITLNGTAHNGKAAVQAFFANSGYFHHHWVSLAPEYKTQITVNGDTAEATTQCVAIDVDSTSPTFHQVIGVIQVNATAVMQAGRWLYTSMNNTSPAPL
jgi:hypothetical protein